MTTVLRYCYGLGLLFVYLGIGGSLGLLVGLIEDFGFVNMTDTIRLNKDVFVDQYLGWIVLSHCTVLLGGALGTIAKLAQCSSYRRRCQEVVGDQSMRGDRVK